MGLMVLFVYMSIGERILEADRKYQEKQQERARLLQMAEDCLTEMYKLQGEWRVLTDLEKDETDKQPGADPAATINVNPAEETE